jgi:hypothetical protein
VDINARIRPNRQFVARLQPAKADFELYAQWALTADGDLAIALHGGIVAFVASWQWWQA